MVTSEPQAVSPRSPFRWGRIVIAVVLIKVGAAIGDLVLAFFFALLAGGTLDKYLAFKTKNIVWLGPAYGGLLFFLCAWWAAKAARGREILHGTLVGVAVLLLEAVVGALFKSWPMLLGEIVVALGASGLGGWVAAQRAARSRPTAPVLSDVPSELRRAYLGADDNVK